MNQETKQVLTLRIDKDLRGRLEAFAKIQDRTLSATVIHLLRVGLGLSSPLTTTDTIDRRPRKTA